jgi:predicted nucleic acid-binding protein
MPVKVADASVIAAWCFGEPRADEARAVLRDADLHAPLLLAYELTNIARKKAVAYPAKTEDLMNALKTALAIPIHWAEVDHPVVFRLSVNAGITSYDASYLYLARKLGAALVTFDEKLARAAKPEKI